MHIHYWSPDPTTKYDAYFGYVCACQEDPKYDPSVATTKEWKDVTCEKCLAKKEMWQKWFDMFIGRFRRDKG